MKSRSPVWNHLRPDYSRQQVINYQNIITLTLELTRLKHTELPQGFEIDWIKRLTENANLS